MSDAAKLARQALVDNWAPNIRDVAHSLARAVIKQAEQIKSLETANEQLHTRLDPLIAVYVAACEVRDSRYSIKTTLDYEDRRLFDRLAISVDAARLDAHVGAPLAGMRAVYEAACAWREAPCDELPFCERGVHEYDCTVMRLERELVAAVAARKAETCVR